MSVNCPIECVKEQPDFLEKHSTFVLTAIGSISALLGVVFSYCIKSRCSNIRTPCISCDRVPIDPDKIATSPEPIKVKEIKIEK